MHQRKRAHHPSHLLPNSSSSTSNPVHHQHYPFDNNSDNNNNHTMKDRDAPVTERMPLHASSTSLPSSSNPNQSEEPLPSQAVTLTNAGLYVLSGCSQPLLMTLCRNAGLADSSSQLYMLFYYFGPALVGLPLLWYRVPWPSQRTIAKGAGIAVFDIFAQTLNYTGASLAGPTIFAIVYSSVTVWTAAFSQVLLGRHMNLWQWLSVVIVFAGLTLTATDSLQLGEKVLHGLTLILLGSMMHALTYVMNEMIMTLGDSKLLPPQNCAIQGTVAMTCFGFWQLVYTLPRWEEKIGHPMHEAGTSIGGAFQLLVLFASANLIHASTFFHTLRHFPGGATSAGIMKALQAVLVFVVTDWAYCGRTGGDEMCFSSGKFLSLVTVTSGVVAYGYATSGRQLGNSTLSVDTKRGSGYQSISNSDKLVERSLT